MSIRRCFDQKSLKSGFSGTQNKHAPTKIKIVCYSRDYNLKILFTLESLKSHYKYLEFSLQSQMAL